MSLSLDIIRQLPKAELHCHLDGFCRPTTIIELAKEQNVTLKTFDLETLTNLMTVPADCPDLPTYLQAFDHPLQVMQHPYAITRIFYEACEDAVKDGITYLELRFAPALHTNNGHSYSQILEAAIDGAVMAESRLPITVRIICCAMRHMSPEVNKKIADIAWRYRHRYVVGFDLAGPENGFPPHKHIEAFRTMREKGVSVTIHAGEAFGAKSVDLAMACNTTRIGHGTRAVEDPETLQQLIDRRIPVEMCVTSNVQTKAITKLEDHPIKQCFEAGLVCVPCTDNPTVSGVTLSGEYFMLQNLFNFDIEAIVRMLDYGFRSAFLSENVKRRLRTEALLKTLTVLTQAGFDISSIKNNESYYAGLGVTIPPKFSFVPPAMKLNLSLVEKMPKCDLDCRLIGSVPLDVLYELSAKEVTLEEFKAKMTADVTQIHTEAKAEAVKLLQTKEALEKAVKAVVAEAIRDNVKYMELTVSPLLHTKGGMTVEEVMEVLIQSMKSDKCEVKLMINCNVASQTVLEFQKLAELAVEYKEKGVVGFATTTQEIGENEWRFYESTFNFLREKRINVQVFAGESDSHTIPIALVRGNARRIAGGFRTLNSDALIQDITGHNMTIIVSLSPRMMDAAKDWFKSPIRTFYDFGVKLAFGSVHMSFSGKTRSQMLLEIAEKSGFDAVDMMNIVGNTFASMFLKYKDAKEYQRKFWEETKGLMKDAGVQSFIRQTWFA